MSDRARRLLSFGVAVLWLLLTGWILLVGASIGAVGIDVAETPLIGWLQLSAMATLACLVGFRWWPTMVLSALAATLLVCDVVRSMAGSSPDVVNALMSIVQLGAVVAALSAVAAVSRVLTCASPSGDALR